MSRLNNFVVNITALTKAVKQKGFGLIMILDDTKNHPYTLYGDIFTLASDFAVDTETYKMASRIFGQNPAPVQIAVAGVDTTSSVDKGADLVTGLNDIVDKDSDWFALTCVANDTETVQAIGNWIDTQHKVYAVTTQDLGAFALMESENTLMGYHNDPDSYLAEGLLAYMLVRTIGGITAKFKGINGVKECDITDTEMAALHENNGFTYVRDMGVLQTTASKVTTGEHFDVVLGKYFIKFRMEEELMSLALSTGKIPYSNQGIAMIMDRSTTVLKMATRNDIILKDEDGKGVFKVDYLDRNEVPKDDIANRKYNNVTWNATLSGAIENVGIGGTLEL